MSYIAVIGAGSWGTTLASLLVEKGYEVSLWTFEKEVAAEINNYFTNNTYLPGVKLPRGLEATDYLPGAVKNARYILNVVPTQFIRSVFREAGKYIHENAVIVSASKGIEHGTLLTAASILNEILGNHSAVLSGPSFAREVISKLPTAVTLATGNSQIGLLLQEIFNTSYFRVYTHSDILGVELGGALKNVIAIASGISDGLGLGHNARAALITRGIAEMMRLGENMGADKRTFSGLSGMGDLVLTCTGPLSRNYSVGVKLGQGAKLNDILSSTKSVAEGVATALSAFELSKKFGVEMPIVEKVYEVLYKDRSPAEAVNMLMNRALRSEF
ncbi:MAG TPA: NAD(P)H-dependent glycerol-3-phosphate dehydrogenase [Candidatus Sulfobium mesophilum]|jgi:glycerol-3-phosphate dehydrogenase (NAD(P)+)|uniref:Glycerol-3-phosphate dehydrogenase [NAD(P)+] n=1 Tax=Candidatus Sulfobium mesophilum TaxID=2016548 RepID=A0A2U3QHG4_9BACT|nr:Glycerol-3-phosphate dehydrogenase (NAD(P)+) [Candidatus Sulfobium mesophilum]HSB31868.1 NAD(P)H-dependent glycerol-3-phosphate dehydrogenase [Candidatus Sulfobium mesophilum]